MSELSDKLATLPIAMTAAYVGRTVDDKWEHDAWKVTITYHGHTYTSDFRQGRGFKATAPKLADVLSCLLSDARSAEEPFEAWCDSLGYDSDSRKAFATYQACMSVRDAMVRLLGSALVQELSALEH